MIDYQLSKMFYFLPLKTAVVEAVFEIKTTKSMRVTLKADQDYRLFFLSA